MRTKQLFSIGLIILGAGLEIWWYFWRFSYEGQPLWLSLTTGAALTLLLALVILWRDQPWAWLFIVTIGLFSVASTAAGQAFFLNADRQEEATTEAREAQRQERIDELEQQIERTNEEYDRISEQIDVTVDSLQDRGLWRTTLAAAEDRQRELTARREKLRQELNQLREQATTHETVAESETDIYRYYESLSGIPARWIQFALQTALSLFVVAMVPVGVMTLPRTQTREPELPAAEPEAAPELTPEPVTIEPLSRDDAERWVRINWIGIRSQKSKHILPKKTYQEFLSNRGEDYDETLYGRIHENARRAGVIAEDGRIIEKGEQSAVDGIMSVEKS